ncbi:MULTISPECIES: heme lyase CcmF/NrfE family subunit [Zoogloea]|jgi:cytochrome c-type biogenesis protein CcmF|uniref:Heme lyase CcmF/NrfE family subunit n=1 Tax=Zoogloea oleivorans TaxID=1552750 RepID=A0A6C2D2E6_9RHOO|nr:MULTISPECIES: heme lyase CcmF/NrfE family subunit [Zoogloea]MDD2668862.1 heme lyase CcmF/NrfE family subunit [Zoogloea sp.]MDY0035547.1 heme lyase CcmF/NrfE family subunit [Zoogloea oleivorans]TYC60084.1 heme lyase CcmF/NrfE family subunit [Zoogloea oleivorans]
MIPEIGSFALILALLVALVQGTLPLIGAQRGIPAWIALARPASATLFLLIAVSFSCLTASFINNDFSVLYVVQHSNSKLPIEYRIAGVWGGHEGSLLLWVQMLALWALAVAAFSRSLPDDMVARVQGVLGLVAAGFILFILTTSSPFERLLPGADDGRDLNPLLQDPGLIFHPPMLYMGYVGFSVAFAFAIAALLSGRLDAAWARWSRPWTTAAWIFLTLGIGLGSIWAYYELGWGGWWFWDPVENASFMPWLVGTALIHSLAVTEKRGSFKNWTVLLAIGAFSLSLLGTFLVRSGVLSSVHAFASDPKRGVFILLFLVVVVGASLTLFAWRAPKVSLGGAFSLISRETFLLINNVLLLSATGAVFLGTLYPLVIDALNLGKLSVGPPYFNAVFAPLMVPVLFLMALGPVARWKQTNLADIVRPLRWAFGIAVAVGVSVPFIAGAWSAGVALGIGLAAWIVGSSVVQIIARVKSSLPPRAFWGMHLAHIGIAVTVVGIVMVKYYESERDVRMAPGDTVKTGDYLIRFKGVESAPGPNYTAARGNLELIRDGQVVMQLHPEKRKYLSSAMPMTEAFIDPGLTRDIYVSLGDPLEGGDGAWSVRVYYKPFVSWIWAGAVLMALGGILAASDRRYRLKSTAAKASAGLAAHGAAS